MAGPHNKFSSSLPYSQQVPGIWFIILQMSMKHYRFSVAGPHNKFSSSLPYSQQVPAWYMVYYITNVNETL